MPGSAFSRAVALRNRGLSPIPFESAAATTHGQVANALVSCTGGAAVFSGFE
jgi:hypothetical protein